MNCPIHHQEIMGYEVIETNEKFLSCPVCLILARNSSVGEQAKSKIKPELTDNNKIYKVIEVDDQHQFGSYQIKKYNIYEISNNKLLHTLYKKESAELFCKLLNDNLVNINVNASDLVELSLLLKNRKHGEYLEIMVVLRYFLEKNLNSKG
jgi:GTP-sensing pleiotropic transcriptional regulator CodY